MLNLEIANCFLTIGIVFFAYMQWRCADIQRKTEIFKYRTKHLQDLKDIWNKIFENINYIKGYKASYIKPDNYNFIYNLLLKTLDNHLAFTKCFYPKFIYNQEKELIKEIISIIPKPAIDATIFDLDINKLDIVNDKYQELCQSCFDSIACNTLLKRIAKSLNRRIKKIKKFVYGIKNLSRGL